MSQKSVALLASTSRPSTEISPCCSNCSALSTSIAVMRPVCLPLRCVRSGVRVPPREASDTAGGSAAVAVGAGADVPTRVQREAAEGTGRPAGGDEGKGALDEGPRRQAGDAHPQQWGPILRLVDEGGLVVRVVLGHRLRLDDQPLVVDVPGQ